MLKWGLKNLSDGLCGGHFMVKLRIAEMWRQGISAMKLVSKMSFCKTNIKVETTNYQNSICNFIKNPREDVYLQLTCLQWFSNTMRQVSGSAVQGLEGTTLRLDRLPGPRGFNLLSQLILEPVGGRSKVTGTQRRERELRQNS